MKHLHDPAVVRELHDRIGQLGPDTRRLWGKMSVAQMLAHCAMAMENSLGDFDLPRHPLGRIIGGMAKRSLLTKGKPMGRSAPTHPSVLITDDRNFELERRRLLATIDRFAAGPAVVTRTPHFFFGKMTPQEWASFMYIHLDHHLQQFGV